MPRTPALAAALVAAALVAPALAQPPDASPGTAYPDDLAVGPFDATFSPAHNGVLNDDRNKPRKVSVLFVTKKKVVVREAQGVVAYDAGKVVSVAGLKADGKTEVGKAQLWTFDKEARAMTGPVLPRPPVVTAPNPVTPAQLGVYLLLRAERLHRGLDAAIDRRDGVLADDLARAGDRLREEAERNRQPTAVVELFRLGDYARTHLANMKRQDDAVATLRDIKLSADQRMGAAAMEAVTRGGAIGLLGGSGRDVIDEVDRFVGQQVAIEAQTKILAAEPQRAFREAAQARAAGRAALAGRLDAAAAGLRVDKGVLTRLEDLAGQLATARDDGRAVAFLTARADLAARAAGGRRSPLLVCEIARLKARGLEAGTVNDRADRADRLVALAREAEAAVRDVPPGAVFDGDRAFVLTTAADLVHRAVATATGPLRWSEAHDPRAEYGVRLADAALAYGVAYDANGEARAARAWLLFQRGMYQAAADEGKGAAAARPADPVTQYNLARVYGKTLSGKTAQDTYPALEAVEKALKAGFYDLAAARTDPDLIAARVDQAKWTDLTKANVEAVIEPTAGKAAGQYRFNLWVHNKSRFALKDVAVTYKGRVKSRPDPKGWEPFTRTPTIGYLAPGRSFLVTDMPEGLDFDLDAGRYPVLLRSPYLAGEVRVAARRGTVEYVPFWMRPSPFLRGGL